MNVAIPFQLRFSQLFLTIELNQFKGWVTCLRNSKKGQKLPTKLRYRYCKLRYWYRLPKQIPVPTKLRYRYRKLWYIYHSPERIPVHMKLIYQYRLPEQIPVHIKLQYWYRKIRYRYRSPKQIPVHTKLQYQHHKLLYQYRVNIFNGKYSRIPYYLLPRSYLSAAEQRERRSLLYIVKERGQRIKRQYLI